MLLIIYKVTCVKDQMRYLYSTCMFYLLGKLMSQHVANHITEPITCACFTVTSQLRGYLIFRDHVI